MSQHYLTVTQLTGIIREVLQQDVRLVKVWVQGEISNFTHHPRGHMYFHLKDEQSRIKAVMFAGQNRRLRFQPENGMMVLACGSVSLYERDGQLQLYVQEMHPAGLGDLYLAFEQLKKRLEAEGLFRAEHKKPLPPFPQKVGIITSPTGAAIRDILTTLRRRYPLVHIIIAPVAVQGELAVPSIVEAIRAFNEHQDVDLLIVGRGGGSIEELWAFNEEQLARAIFASRIPVISAVGHETDVTIADWVADVRAPTPTAAAELAVPNLEEVRNHLQHLQQRLRLALVQKVERKKEHLARLNQSLTSARLVERLMREEQRLDHLLDKLQRYPALLAERLEQKRQQLHTRLVERMQKRLDKETHQLELLLRQLDALSPLKVMQRGYALVKDRQGELVISVQGIQPGDRLNIHLRDGKVHTIVHSVEQAPERIGREEAEDG